MKRQCNETANPHISLTGFRLSFSKWKESTTTSPSGRHLGHMKSLLHTIDNQSESWPSSCVCPKDIFEAIYRLTNLCITHCHVLPRWETVHNLLIQKEEGNQKIHRLRTIHIQECDWQAILCITIAKKTIPNAAAHRKIHSDQWGECLVRRPLILPSNASKN